MNNSTAQCNFVDVAAQQNISHSFGTGLLDSGVSFMDFDGDGWDDLTFGTSEGELVEVYRNDQGNFEKITLQGVTSMDDPLVMEIEYTMTSGRLLVTLHSDLADHFQEATLLNASGQAMEHIQKVGPGNTLPFNEIPKNQMFIVNLGFKEGRLVKKLLVKE